MIKEKIKFIFVFIMVLMIIVISSAYLGYYMYYEGYIASDISTCDCINYVVKEILLSENTSEKKKELIEKTCSYSYAEITINNLSDNTIFYKKESWIQNKSIFKEIVFSATIVETKEGQYSIKYTNYLPKFYTTMRYCIFLGKHMTKV